ncbi:MAG: hypothetical protein KAU06_04795 [Candidatus Marinimicrobia bacterium]|nr:hypothetical protein [Candidatus Neomarinimicrobiota bacterium]
MINGKIRQFSPIVLYIYARCRWIAKERKRAGKKGHEFTITLQDVEDIIFQDCYYCGKKPAQKVERDEKLYNGIDRFDNDKGYVRENLVPACGKCNRRKRQADFQEYLDTCRRVVAKWGMK